MRQDINKRLIKLLLCSLIFILMPGCMGAREINDVEIVVGIAVDKGNEPEPFVLTAQIVKPGAMGKSSGDSSSGEKKAYWNVSYTGKTVFEAAREITLKTGNKLFLGHEQVLIFGKDIAEENIQKSIDFFLRANTIRPGTLVLVAEGKASDILDTVSGKEKLPAINASKLVKHYGYASRSFEINLNDFAERLLSITTCPIAPLVKVVTDKEKDVAISGMAVFNRGKMAGVLDETETRGLLWVLDKVESGAIIVPTPGGKGKASLEIIDAKSKTTPEISSGKIVFNIRVQEKATLTEQSTDENIGTVEGFEVLQKIQAEAIKQEILAAYKKSRELGCDIFGFGEMLHKKYAKQWKTFEGKWNDIYPALELNVDIQTKIIGTDLLTKPATPPKED